MTGLWIGYLVLALIVAVFGALGVFHAHRYGYPGDKTSLATLLYIGSFAATLIISTVLIIGTDWSGF